MRSILIAEDSDEDFEALQRIISKFTSVELIRCVDGEEVLSYLTKARVLSTKPPSVILLDLNMPGIDGRETLVRLKSDTELRAIPTVVLSTSSNDRDISYCYTHGANGYMSKPVSYTELERKIRIFIDYWKHAMLLTTDYIQDSP